MFGHQDEPTQQTNVSNSQPAQSPADTGYLVGAPNPALPPADMSFAPTVQTADTSAWQTQAAPAVPVSDPNQLLEPQATDGFTGPAPTPAEPAFAAPAQTVPVTDQAAPTVGTPSPLNDLKQQALQQLSPLVGHLDQTPEEKFRTTMMLIQASDNQDLLQTAYDAANQITDEKAKAQALLDVINEINYFSQQSAA